MKIIDCFLFNNELKLLELRLLELYDIVDYFVLVESEFYFSGNKKPLHYLKNKNKFLKYNDKIIHITQKENHYDSKNKWSNEIYQRNLINEGIKLLNLNDNDIIIISDCDEIPDPNTITDIKNNDIDNIYNLKMDMYYYNITCRALYGCQRSTVIKYSKYKELNSDCEKITLLKNKKDYKLPGGWHFSYYGGIDNIKDKIKNFSHQEFNKPEYLDDLKIKKQIENYDDLFFRKNEENHFFRRVELKENNYLPKNYKLLL